MGYSENRLFLDKMAELAREVREQHDCRNTNFCDFTGIPMSAYLLLAKDIKQRMKDYEEAMNCKFKAGMAVVERFAKMDIEPNMMMAVIQLVHFIIAADKFLMHGEKFMENFLHGKLINPN